MSQRETDRPTLVVAISSRALFDLDESHRVFEEQGIEAYHLYQVEHEDDILQPGVAFSLVRKLLNLNALFRGRVKVEVVLLSRNSADTGLRVFNSIEHHGLEITRAAFTGGRSPFEYASVLDAHLFLSADSEDVACALNAGVAAATITPAVGSNRMVEASSAGSMPEQLRIAFDGDAVLFSDEAEQVYRQQGLEAFEASEKAAAKRPLEAGPFRCFLEVLHQMQSLVPEGTSPIRTALVTARGAPAHERVIRTLRSWGIRIDEALFLGGMDKSAFLKAFQADIFFDDQTHHVESAAQFVPAGHVPHGVANKT
ncbi:MAG TPA: 5'-nucleotidase [Thiolapillus brandeum]|uniref:5'-nucleotidase n=1 Tax=Thiolapillus brandeum TaxID=1076588 RepID=A0A831K302_9GAMM|nr:5'-nucleotidase [Thiolapillus brandeum]